MSLANRFSGEVFAEWQDWYICLECGKNTGNILHHIISPSNKYYVKGNHNTSILNSIKLCNEVCHLYNPELHKTYKTKEFLYKTIEVLKVKNYKLKDIDLEFLEVYKNLYAK